MKVGLVWQCILWTACSPTSRATVRQPASGKRVGQAATVSVSATQAQLNAALVAAGSAYYELYRARFAEVIAESAMTGYFAYEVNEYAAIQFEPTLARDQYGNCLLYTSDAADD